MNKLLISLKAFSRNITLIFLLLHTKLTPHGFAPDTLVKTPTGYTHIKDLNDGDFVITCDKTHHCQTSIIAKKLLPVSSHIHIRCGNEYLALAKDHRVYVSTKKRWITAQELAIGDVLSATAIIDEISEEHGNIELIDIALKEHHTFFVCRHDVVVHNFFFAVPVLTYTIGQGIAWATGATILGALGTGLFREGVRKTIRNIPTNIGGSGSLQPDNLDPNEDDKPHGKYDGAGYHHPQSRGGQGKGCKSPSPKNGQRALNNSVEVLDKNGDPKERIRIAVDNEQFVVLNETVPGEYHGHVRKWNRLNDYMKNALIDNNLVKKSGKIINHG
jgi:hypothetical protein